MSTSPVAIVTGGAQGIGAAICLELLKKGYRVCVADIEDVKAQEFAKEQQEIFGEGNVTAIRCDVTKEAEYENIFEKILKKFGRIDVLVNNAGIVEEQNPRKCLEVNLLGPVFGCHAALKYMGKSKGGNGGTVINTSSVVAFSPSARMPTYTATKNGLVALTRCFGLPFHFDKDGIIFAAVCPYLVNTDILNSVTKTLDPTMDYSKVPDKMSPEHVAKAVLKLLEDKINGSALVVLPGGYHYMEFKDELKKLMSKTNK